MRRQRRKALDTCDLCFWSRYGWTSSNSRLQAAKLSYHDYTGEQASSHDFRRRLQANQLFQHAPTAVHGPEQAPAQPIKWRARKSRPANIPGKLTMTRSLRVVHLQQSLSAKGGCCRRPKSLKGPQLERSPCGVGESTSDAVRLTAVPSPMSCKVSYEESCRRRKEPRDISHKFHIDAAVLLRVLYWRGCRSISFMHTSAMGSGWSWMSFQIPSGFQL